MKSPLPFAAPSRSGSNSNLASSWFCELPRKSAKYVVNGWPLQSPSELLSVVPYPNLPGCQRHHAIDVTPWGQRVLIAHPAKWWPTTSNHYFLCWTYRHACIRPSMHSEKEKFIFRFFPWYNVPGKCEKSPMASYLLETKPCRFLSHVFARSVNWADVCILYDLGASL